MNTYSFDNNRASRQTPDRTATISVQPTTGPLHPLPFQVLLGNNHPRLCCEEGSCKRTGSQAPGHPNRAPRTVGLCHNPTDRTKLSGLLLSPPQMGLKCRAQQSRESSMLERIFRSSLLGSLRLRYLHHPPPRHLQTSFSVGALLAG